METTNKQTIRQLKKELRAYYIALQQDEERSFDNIENIFYYIEQLK